jgi:hypothetical protein
MSQALEQILRPDGQYANLDSAAVRSNLVQLDMLEVVDSYRENATSDPQAIDNLLSCVRQQQEDVSCEQLV